MEYLDYATNARAIWYQKWLAKKRPLLTKETAAKRYKWAKEYSK
jgi:hypothetical protein